MPGQQQLSAPGASYRDPTDYWLPIVGIVRPSAVAVR